MKFGSGVLGFEPPLDTNSGGVALPHQCLDFPPERILVGEPLLQAAAGQHAELDFRHIHRHSPDRTTFPGYSSRRDAANYNLAFQGRQMRPDSLKFLLSWTNHRPAKRKISKPLVYDQVSSLGSPFALYDPVTVINPDAPKVD